MPKYRVARTYRRASELMYGAERLPMMSPYSVFSSTTTAMRVGCLLGADARTGEAAACCAEADGRATRARTAAAMRAARGPMGQHTADGCGGFCATKGCPMPRLISRREGSRHRSGHGSVRVRHRPRKRKPPEGGALRVLADLCRPPTGAPPEDDLRRRQRAIEDFGPDAVVLEESFVGVD